MRNERMKLLNFKEAAEQLGVPVDGVRDLVAHRQIPVVRLSPRRLRIKESDLRDYVESRTIRSILR